MEDTMRNHADESYVETSPAATTFVGSDATKLFAAATVRSAINLYLKTGMKANRAYTPANMLKFATNTTGKTYKRGKPGLTAAAADLEQWIAAMKSALPVVDKQP